MLRLLLFLCAVAMVAASTETIIFTSDQMVNISSCPIHYYGVMYDNIYVKFTDSQLVICFDGMYNPAVGGDCVIGPRPGRVEFGINNNYQSGNKSGCAITFNANLPDDVYFVNFDNLGTEAKLEIFSTVTESFDVMVSGSIVETMTVPGFEPAERDIIKCRYAGVMHEVGSEVSYDPNTCVNTTCASDGTLKSNGCGAMKICLGDKGCDAGAVCTVTGSAVIDVNGQSKTINDRCSYSLLKVTSNQDFEMNANFKDRRRTDMSFLDSVTLLLNDGSNVIKLEQGNRAWLDDSMMTLNSTVQTVQGVEISGDNQGITASLSLTNDTSASIFFDGNTVQILIEGPDVNSLQGLCGGLSISESLQEPSDNSQSCQVSHPQPEDTSIDCAAATERCNLLMQSPFDDCHPNSDPQPFIDACTETLCKYPTIDGINCQFLEAYARSCQLKSVTLQSWRADAGCPAPEVLCQDKTCSSDEFCGEKTLGGDTRCFCRAIFASTYNVSLDEPTNCNQNSASVTLANCLLEDKGFEPSMLHLNDDTCKGEVDEENHMVTFSFNGTNLCGAEITTDGEKVIYTNSIKTGSTSSGLITRYDQFNINFSCIHIQPEIETVAFKIKDSSVIQDVTSGDWSYTVILQAFSDGGLTQPLDPNTELQLNQKIWVKLDTVGLEGSPVALVTDSCWATKDQTSTSDPRYNLISSGCADAGDSTVEVTGNGQGTSNSFSFNMFQFTGSTGDVYLHCKLELCVKASNTCTPNCSGASRRRRSVRRATATATIISMMWRK